MPVMQARRCSTTAADLGEGISWDETTRELFWVDILGRRLHRADVAGGDLIEHAPFTVDRHIGVAVPIAGTGAGWLLAAGQGFASLDRAGSFRVLAEPEAGTQPLRRMNDGACDPQGRFWAGSMAYDETAGAGSLYCVDLDGSVRMPVARVTVSNGIGWSPDGGLMYYNDSVSGSVDVFDFDGEGGAVSNRRHLVEIPADQGLPDGLCVDADGFVWVALWNGGAVQRYDPSGRLVTRVEVPVSRPTSCCFGGDERATLYISTARGGPAGAGAADAGRVFAVEPGVTGPPVMPFRGRLPVG